MKKELKLADFRKKIPVKIQKRMFNGRLIELVENRWGHMIDYDVYLPSKKMNLQRPLCWTLEQKRELIRSVIKGCDIQDFSVILYIDDLDRVKRTTTYKIVDGKQRLSTLIGFCRNEFTLDADGEEYLYSELPKEIKEVIDNFNILFNQTYEYPDDLIPDEVKINWFEMINFMGTPQDTQHLKKLKGDWITFTILSKDEIESDRSSAYDYLI